jgi:hypothetical protein
MSIGRMDPGARERLTVAALLVSVFMAGALTGAAALKVVGLPSTAQPATSDVADRPDFDRRGDGDRFRDEASRSASSSVRTRISTSLAAAALTATCRSNSATPLE